MSLVAGAAVADITPIDSQFLFGYPHVPRHSTGVHDPLLAIALYLGDGREQAILIANDIIFVSRASAARVRARIAAETGVRPDAIMISATHTHSGPITVYSLSSSSDPVVPGMDEAYMRRMENGIVRAATAAYAARRPAEAGLAVGDATGIGTNRHDPAGPADLSLPVLMVRDARDHKPLAAMLICSMHPTVLHEDSTLVSGDFPAFARIYLQNVLGADCPILRHTGPAGNQSPRHVTRGNTFEEAKRLGEIVGRAAERIIGAINYSGELPLRVKSALVNPPRRQIPDVTSAQRQLDEAAARLERLRAEDAPRTAVRTAECDWFGAEESLTLARAAIDGRLERALAGSLPAEVQVIGLGPWSFVAWPGEVFVEFGLELKRRRPNTFLITLANGELQGYLATEQAVRENWYEATNATLQSPQAGNMLLEKSMELLGG